MIGRKEGLLLLLLLFDSVFLFLCLFLLLGVLVVFVGWLVDLVVEGSSSLTRLGGLHWKGVCSDTSLFSLLIWLFTGHPQTHLPHPRCARASRPPRAGRYGRASRGPGCGGWGLEKGGGRAWRGCHSGGLKRSDWAESVCSGCWCCCFWTLKRKWRTFAWGRSAIGKKKKKKRAVVSGAWSSLWGRRPPSRARLLASGSVSSRCLRVVVSLVQRKKVWNGHDERRKMMKKKRLRGYVQLGLSLRHP